MAIDVTTIIPIIVGLIFVGIAVIERGWKKYLEAKKTDPTLKFDAAYMLNFWVSASLGSVIVIGVIPVILSQLDTGSTIITLGSVILNAILGYSTAWTALDKMNTSTENNIKAK